MQEAKKVITYHGEPTITVELTEAEFDIVSIAVAWFKEAIENGEIELDMEEKGAYELGQAVGGLLNTFEIGEDDED